MRTRWMLGVLVFVLGTAGPAPAQAPLPLSELQERAEKGDAEARNALGNAYTNGLLGLQLDFGEALRWYQLASDQGYAPAQFNLGLAFELGRGVPTDEARAFSFYLQAAEQGFTPAQFNVANLYAAGRGTKQDLFEANLWYRQAAQKGFPEAQFNLAIAYETGRGIKQDEVQAAYWYRQAADRGYALAQYNLGLMTEDGRGVAKDENAAVQLYRAAAERGNAAAQNNYGLMLYEGRGGLTKDPIEAYAWLSLAVENGLEPRARDLVGAELTGAQRSLAAESLARHRAAAIAPAPAPPVLPIATIASTPQPSTRAAPVTADKERVAVAAPPPVGEVAALQDQVRRLARQVLNLTASRNDDAAEIARLRALAPESGESPAAKSSAGSESLSDDEKQSALAALARLDELNRKVTEENDRLRQQVAAANSRRPVGRDNETSTVIANLQRDNARLTDELRRLRSTRAPSTTDQELIAELKARIRDLTALTPAPVPVRPATRSENSTIARLQQKIETLQRENAELEKWLALLERNLMERKPPARGN